MLTKGQLIQQWFDNLRMTAFGANFEAELRMGKPKIKLLGRSIIHGGQESPGLVFGRKCNITNNLFKIRITTALLEELKEFKYVQDLSLNKDQAEFLMTNNTPAEWDEMFKEDEM